MFPGLASTGLIASPSISRKISIRNPQQRIDQKETHATETPILRRDIVVHVAVFRRR
jgi:hypothetical protein